MQLFVIDENGHVVFEFNTDHGNDRGYHLNSSKVMQAKMIKTVKEALQFLERRP